MKGIIIATILLLTADNAYSMSTNKQNTNNTITLENNKQTGNNVSTQNNSTKQNQKEEIPAKKPHYLSRKEQQEFLESFAAYVNHKSLEDYQKEEQERRINFRNRLK